MEPKDLFTVKVLGSGTSVGVPVIGCECRVCRSSDSRDNRLRSSVLISTASGNILIDATPDFRQQALSNSITQLSAILITHTHADHIFFFFFVRPINFIHNTSIPLYLNQESKIQIEQTFNYIFKSNDKYEGGGLPNLSLNIIEEEKFNLLGLEIIPLPIMHGKWKILGFRIGDFAYLTDCSMIPEATYELLRNLKVLMIDGLRYTPHPTHFTINDSIAEVEKIKPLKAYITHINHEIAHEEGNDYIRKNTNYDVELAYDGLLIEI